MQNHFSLDQALDDIAGIIVNLPTAEQTSVVLVLTLILSRVSDIQREAEETIARFSRATASHSRISARWASSGSALKRASLG